MRFVVCASDENIGIDWFDEKRHRMKLATCDNFAQPQQLPQSGPTIFAFHRRYSRFSWLHTACPYLSSSVSVGGRPATDFTEFATFVEYSPRICIPRVVLPVDSLERFEGMPMPKVRGAFHLVNIVQSLIVPPQSIEVENEGWDHVL